MKDPIGPKINTFFDLAHTLKASKSRAALGVEEIYKVPEGVHFSQISVAPKPLPIDEIRNKSSRPSNFGKSE